jgi:transcriptional regulator with XRE-family HTH domain
MEFLDKIQKKLNLSTKKEMAQLLEITPQSYYSLERAADRITIRDLIRLRKRTGLSDTELLDLIEEECNVPEEHRKRRPI